MIIIDGFDNTGKTTLARKIAREMGLEYIHSPGPLSAPRMFDWCLKEIAYRRLAVYDRFAALTDQIYGLVLRGGSPFHINEEGRLIVKLLEVRNPLIIYCRPKDTEKILKFEDGRDQMNGVIEHSRELLETYDRFYEWYKMNGWKIVTYDYENDNIGIVTVPIRQTLQRMYYERRLLSL